MIQSLAPHAISDTETINVLDVCTDGTDLYRTEFKNGKYKETDSLFIPFDLVVIAGTPAPRGHFYELEYLIGGPGNVYRALLQLVEPVFDIRCVLAAMQRAGKLPEGFTPRRAWQRADIDAVHVGECHKDEDGEAVFGHTLSRPIDNQKTITSTVTEVGHVCLECYGTDGIVEFWVEKEDIDSFPPVLVLGTASVNDPAHADQRRADLEEMWDHIKDAMVIAQDYLIPHIIGLPSIDPDADGKHDNVVYFSDSDYLLRFAAEVNGYLNKAQSEQTQE